MPALERLDALDHGPLVLVCRYLATWHITEALEALSKLPDACVELPWLELARRQWRQRRVPPAILLKCKILGQRLAQCRVERKRGRSISHGLRQTILLECVTQHRPRVESTG